MGVEERKTYKVRITDTVVPGTSPVRLTPSEGGSYVFIRSGEPSRFQLEHEMEISLRTASQLRNDGYEVLEIAPETTTQPSRPPRRRR